MLRRQVHVHIDELHPGGGDHGAESHTRRRLNDLVGDNFLHTGLSRPDKKGLRQGSQLIFFLFLRPKREKKAILLPTRRVSESTSHRHDTISPSFSGQVCHLRRRKQQSSRPDSRGPCAVHTETGTKRGGGEVLPRPQRLDVVVVVHDDDDEHFPRARRASRDLVEAATNALFFVFWRKKSPVAENCAHETACSEEKEAQALFFFSFPQTFAKCVRTQCGLRAPSARCSRSGRCALWRLTLESELFLPVPSR